jgi:uncharacterized membrane protein
MTRTAAFVARARWFLQLSWATLVVTLTLWHSLRLQPVGAALAIVFTVGPWLVLWPAVWRGNRRAHVLAAILAAPTLAYALMELLANPGAHTLAGTTLFAAFAVFIGATAWLRLSPPPVPRAKTAR